MIEQRIDDLTDIIEDLQSTNSYNEKLYIVNSIPLWLQDDFKCILEVLDGKYVFGFKMPEEEYDDRIDGSMEFVTIREAIEWLMQPMCEHNLTQDNINDHLYALSTDLYEFLVPIVNKTLRLGIGHSLLTKDDTAPMLANKYESGKLQYDPLGYFITEKLDGNRCIAFYWNDKWNFISRNGKPMHVSFDMTGLATQYIYDGEVLSREQVEMSIEINRKMLEQSKFPGSMIQGIYGKTNSMFNSTSGLINRHGGNKDLVYNIFDIQRPEIPYRARRKILEALPQDRLTNFVTSNVRVLPILCCLGADSPTFDEIVTDMLYKVTDQGGEGIMINLASAGYSHKRTKNLLKYKQAKTMDMMVVDTYPGEGKYIGQVGGLTCRCATPDFKIVCCNVGTGLSDAQRLEWKLHPDKIINKIVEVEYFSLSQDELSKGTNNYSLRFPRLKKVREDKNTTSIY